MVKFCLQINQEKSLDCGLPEVYKGNGVTLYSNQDVFAHTQDKNKCFVFGNILGVRKDGKFIKKNAEQINWLNSDAATLRKETEGEFIVIRYTEKNGWEVFQDKFARQDVYYKSFQGSLIMTSFLSALEPYINGYDPIGMASYLTIYGYRTPKKDTIYKSIKRLGVGELVNFKTDKPIISQFPIELQNTQNFKEKDLDVYAESFLEAIEKRSSEKGNIVLLSSGWDSSALLATLIKLKGASKVRAVTGRLVYSTRTKELNTFEIVRAKQIADHFGVAHEVIDLDYSLNGHENFRDVAAVMKDQHIWGITAVGLGRLIKKINETKSEGEVVFSGEVSDGAHNFGFSQFTTIFHPDLNFREYSDKMLSYLFGPSFTKEITKGNIKQNFVYTSLKQRMGDALFVEYQKDSKGVLRQQLESMFVTGNRFPGYSIYNNKFLTHKACEEYMAEMSKYFIPYQDILTEDNLYAAYLDLYNSFHWQGGTVSALKILGDATERQTALPFWDNGVLEFLAAMPETFGRGLDLNPTKYPLKHFLKNKLGNYPFDLQIGPHSYLYDVEEGFSLGGEFLNHSSLAPDFREFFKSERYLKYLDSEYFNISYFQEITAKYVKHEKLSSTETELLLRLASLNATGTF